MHKVRIYFWLKKNYIIYSAIQREQLFEYVFGSGCGKGKAVAIGSNLLPIKLCQYVHVFA